MKRGGEKSESGLFHWLSKDDFEIHNGVISINQGKTDYDLIKEGKLYNNPFTNKKYVVGKSFKIIQHPQHYYNTPLKCRKWHIDVEISNELGYLMYHPTTNTWDFYEEFVISERSSSCCCKYKTIRAIKKALLKWKLPVGAIVTCTGRYIEDTYKFKIL